MTKRKREETQPINGQTSLTDTANLSGKFRVLLQQIINYSNVDIAWVDYLDKISKNLAEFSRCDSIELHIKKRDEKYACKIIKRTEQLFEYEIYTSTPIKKMKNSQNVKVVPGLKRFYEAGEESKIDPSLPFVTNNGSFWTGDIKSTLKKYTEKKIKKIFYSFRPGNNFTSIAIIPIKVGSQIIGLLQLMSREKNFFTETEIEFYENFVQNLGLVLLNQRSQTALKERVKEMTCLYGIAHAVEQYGISLDKIFKKTVKLIPPAWQYPEITESRILFNGKAYFTPGFKEGPHKQVSDIVVNGEKRGEVEVVYTEKKQILDEGPFLNEERHLLNAITSELALIIERSHAELEERNLQAQLRHADRLATIGQLASGVAHELNEPLTSILGFSQLVNKNAELPNQVRQDITRIVNASLHAREIVKKLLIFSRQMPTKKAKVDLNSLIKEGVYFLESRCIKEGIQLTYHLAECLPEMVIDPSQLKQVVINLVVNAIQAMPEGGKLDIQTNACNGHISIIVEDTGTGISQEVLKQIFIPFFTTKDIGEGTGLGLSVVHGIVSSHGGSISVDSKVGSGSRFEVTLPLVEPAKAEEN